MNKRGLVLITKCFAGFLILLTLFSNTIYNVSIPAAAVQFPETGFYEKNAEGEGYVSFAKEQTYYADTTGSVIMYVKEGDVVTTGQMLYTIKKDIDSIQKELEDLALEERQLQLQIETAGQNITLAQQAAMQAEEKMQNSHKTAELWEFEMEEETLKNKIGRLEKDIADKKILVDSGAVPLQELRDLEKELEELNLQWSHLQIKKEKEMKKQEDDNEEKQESLEDTVKEKNKLAAGYEMDLKDLALQLEKNRLKRSRLQEQLVTEEITQYAQAEGIVTEENKKLQESRYISEDDWLLKIGGLAEGFYTDIEFPETANFIGVGEEVFLDAPGAKQYGVPGSIVKIYPQEGNVKARIQFEAAGFTGGERVRCSVVSRTQTEGQILPQTAIRQDDDGYYLLYAETIRSTFGTETYAKKMPVGVQEKGDGKWVVYFYSYETKVPVIVNSDKPIYEGDRIKIFSGSDIIEIRE